MNKNKKLSFLLLMFILVGITFSKTSWGQPNLPSALTITYAPDLGAPMGVNFFAGTSSRGPAPHYFPDFMQSSHTFPQLSLPYITFVINAHYTNPNPPYNTVYYEYTVDRADVVAANGSGVYYYSNGAQLIIWSTGWHQYSFKIQRPVGP